MRYIPVVLAIFASTVFGQTPDAAGLPKIANSPLFDTVDKIKATKRLPVNGLSIVETTDGKTVLISDNGRFAVMGGRWMDLWEGKTVTGVADSNSLDKINFARMGINIDEFSPFVIGTGKQNILVFVDPTCSACRKMVREMSSLGNDYTFKVVILPLTGSDSGAAARKMQCAPERKLALDAFINNTFASLPDSATSCDVSPIQKALISATILGIRRTPFIILPDFTALTEIGEKTTLAQILAKK